MNCTVVGVTECPRSFHYYHNWRILSNVEKPITYHRKQFQHWNHHHFISITSSSFSKPWWSVQLVHIFFCNDCGVSTHDHKMQCFDKSYLNNIACCECWVYKNVPGARRHEVTDCQAYGRLLWLLSHHYVKSGEIKSFQQFIEGISTSTESFCQFMAQIDALYVKWFFLNRMPLHITDRNITQTMFEPPTWEESQPQQNEY